jgi:undecaprenyl-phosphate galactose phosphotransferase
VVLAAAILFLDGRPVFFFQRRIGMHGRPFPCLKFRTMVPDAEVRLQALLESDPAARAEWQRDRKLRNDPRVSRVGAWLRRTSLDELPQLFNVIRGEMSLIGPRPVVEEELRRYGPRAVFYLKTRPGLSGLWQVSGRNDLDYGHRVQLDCQYVRNWSPWWDVALLLATVRAVFTRRGAY